MGAVTKLDNISCLGPSRDLAGCERVRSVRYPHPGAFRKMFRNGGMVVMVLTHVSRRVLSLLESTGVLMFGDDGKLLKAWHGKAH